MKAFDNMTDEEFRSAHEIIEKARKCKSALGGDATIGDVCDMCSKMLESRGVVKDGKIQVSYDELKKAIKSAMKEIYNTKEIVN